MSKNAIAFLAGLGSGYMTAGKDKEKQKRDDEDRALRNKASQLQIDQVEQGIKDKRTIAEAGAPIAMTEGAGGMVKPATMDNRDVGLPENATLPNQGLQEGGYSVGGKAFTDPAAAQTELATQNAPAARQQRVIAAMSGIDPVKAMDLEQTQTQRGRETTKFTQEQEAYAKKLKDEGAIDALKALRGGDGAGMVAAFNKGGQYKILGEPVLTPEQREIPGIGVVPTYTATFKVQGEDGKPKDMTVNSHDLGLRLMPYEKFLDTQLKVSKESREGRESNSKIGLQGAQANYYESAAGAKDATAAKPIAEKMSEPDKMAFASINKQRETITTAMTKAQAEGSWDENSPGAKQLKTKLAALTMQESQLVGKYGDGAGAAPDPLGMRKPAAGGRQSQPVQPGSAKSGQVDILNQEWAKAQSQLASAKTPEEKTRAQGDLTALSREFSNLKASPPGAATNMATGGAIAAPAAPARTAAPPVAAPVAAAPAAPAPAAPAKKPNLAAAMGATTGNATIDKIVAEKAPVVQAAADGITKAKALLASAAKSGDPQALQLYAGQVQQARDQFDALLKDMTPQQAEAVRQATGYYL